MHDTQVGIYLFTNTANQKCYVGKSVTLPARRWQHLTDLRRGCHANRHLQAAWKKYGEAAFTYSVLQYCNEKDLLYWEDWWMALLDSRNPSKGYNKLEAEHRRHHEESRHRMSESHTGKKATVEHRTHISHALTGRSFSSGHIYNLSRSAQESPACQAQRSALWEQRTRRYQVTSPSGDTLVIRNLAKFCRENGLHQGHMAAVARGKYSQHKGWSVSLIE